jgi:hypothetical protein
LTAQNKIIIFSFSHLTRGFIYPPLELFIMDTIIVYRKEKLLMAQRLQKLIKAKGCSRRWLCRETGISEKNLRDILKGTINMTDETRLRILSALGVTLKQFYNSKTLDSPIPRLDKYNKPG